MLKSLYSGVSGLQSHQVAMDVESNNIANVNTVGFKYSRANFSDLLAQTSTVATAPQGTLGGKNAVQVGLGSTVNSMTRIFSQGSIQSSDKNTDVAIQGDGFFIISPDAGTTYKFTRSGDFKFDAGGNFVDNNGFIAQGWLKNDVTGKVDSTGSPVSINIAPGLTTPANPTSALALKANLNSGSLVKSFSTAYEVPSGTPPSKQSPAVMTGDAIDASGLPIQSGNMGVMVNESGEAFSLQANQGIWASFKNAEVVAGTAIAAGAAVQELDITFTLDDGSTKQITSSGGEATDNASEIGNRFITAINAQKSITGITAIYDANLSKIILSNDNANANASHNINISAVGNTNSGLVAPTVVTTAYKYQYNPLTSSALLNSDKTFTTIADLRNALEVQSHSILEYTVGATGATGTTSAFTINGTAITFTETALNSADVNGAAYAAAITTALAAATTAPAVAGATAVYDATTKKLTITNPSTNELTIAGTIFGSSGITAGPNNVEVTVNAQGKFQVSNAGAGAYDMNIKITGITDVGAGITENTRFTTNMTALNTVLPANTTGKAYSQGFDVATHSSSIDIFDSLGSKHTVRIDFRKESVDANTGSKWSIKVSVPQPGTINIIAPTNEKTGSVSFNNDGSLSSYDPYSISFSGNNGSAPDQQVNLALGTVGAFDGMTSFDSYSATSGISQDGYTGGDLVGIRIDQSGTLIGSFANGRSFGLAQVAMAKFTNNEGLTTEGGNVYTQSANSGNAIIGTAATAGRGFIQSSALEASNVDLSRALTQLIIIQRGYQANGKTITTSDQLLQTLIGLKT